MKKVKIDNRKTWRKHAACCPCLRCVIRGNCQNIVWWGKANIWVFKEDDRCPHFMKWVRNNGGISRGTFNELKRKGLWKGKIVISKTPHLYYFYREIRLEDFDSGGLLDMRTQEN